jgi:hypothetical protein
MSMYNPAVTRITTRLSFEKVNRMLQTYCQSPYTISFAAAENEIAERLTLNLIFADPLDLKRFRRAIRRQRRGWLNWRRHLDRVRLMLSHSTTQLDMAVKRLHVWLHT